MPKPVRIFWRLFFAGLAAFVLLVLGINFFGNLPSLKELENPSMVLASEVYGDDGTSMGKYYREKGNRSNTNYNDISPNVINALVATEDVRFYEHSGIDGYAIMRAIVKLGHDGGGSTLTQQLAKNMLGQGSRNIFLRLIEKLEEWITAIKLERNFTKQEIITLYLNAVPFGDNQYGIRNAAKTFFQKNPDQLNTEEAAMLIGMLKGNWLYNPRINPKPAIDRRNTVISQMVKSNYLTAADAAAIKVRPIDLSGYKKVDENNGIAPYFRDVIRDTLKKWCKEHKNPATGKPYNLYTDGLRIYTTINPRMQINAEEAVVKQLPGLQRALNAQTAIRKGSVWQDHENILENAMKKSDRWKNEKDSGLSVEAIKESFHQPVAMKIFAWNAGREKDTVMTPMDSIRYHLQMLETAFIAMDPITGAVKAWIGGIDFKTFKFDHANLNTKRQVGSSIKPFLYSLAIEDFGFTPETVCEATQQFFPDYGNVAVPAKADPRITPGETHTMAYGLAKSTNEVAAYIMKRVTPKRFVKFVKEINIPTKLTPYPSLALGACELSLYEMIWGYTLFPSGGFSTKPYYISRIEDKNGNVLERFDTERKEVISQATAYTMARMMQGAVDSGTARGLRDRLGITEMSGKTGTTNDNSDSWFMGYTPQLLAGVWVGCDNRFIHLDGTLGTGGGAARPIWEYFFAKTLSDKTLGYNRAARFIKPANMKMAEIRENEKTINQTTQPGQSTLPDTASPSIPPDSKPPF